MGTGMGSAHKYLLKMAKFASHEKRFKKGGA